MAFNKQINPYLVGNKVYGGGRPHPTSGPVDKLGYRERDRKHKARRQAILNRMKARAQGRHMSSDAMKEV
ncbi:MAG: hypothetical protein ACREOB_08680 [Thermodesulfobacteriota bacterium]